MAKARELAERHGWFLADQFANPANPAYHRSTTGGEVIQDFAGRPGDGVVTGWGTGGTFTGVGEVLRVARPEVRIVAAEPASASLLGGAEWKPHKVQGWTPDFLPAVLNRELADEVLTVSDEEAIATARRLAIEEGIFVGISAGATAAVALRVAQRAPEGSVVLTVFPDTGERYLSTALFEGVNEGPTTSGWLRWGEASPRASRCSGCRR